MAVEAGADLIGFHFCDSDRRVSPEQARSIIEELLVRPKIVGVFIDEAPDEVRQIWEAARRLLGSRKVFIAGGLQPGNVGKVVSEFRPYGVDVSSGVEARPRVKDPDKVRAFVRAVRLAEAAS